MSFVYNAFGESALSAADLEKHAAPRPFQKAGMSSLFLVNEGSALVLLLIYMLFYGYLWFFYNLLRVVLKHSALKDWIRTKISYVYNYGFFIDIMHSLLTGLAMCAFLQVANIQFSDMKAAAGLALSALCLLFPLAFYGYWQSVIRKNIGVIRKHYDTLGNEIQTLTSTKFYQFRSLWSRLSTDTATQPLFIIAMQGRKYVVALALAFLSGLFYVQLAVLTFFNLFLAIQIYNKKPFLRRRDTAAFMGQELLMGVAQIILLALFQDDQEQQSTRYSAMLSVVVILSLAIIAQMLLSASDLAVKYWAQAKSNFRGGSSKVVGVFEQPRHMTVTNLRKKTVNIKQTESSKGFANNTLTKVTADEEKSFNMVSVPKERSTKSFKTVKKTKKVRINPSQVSALQGEQTNIT